MSQAKFRVWNGKRMLYQEDIYLLPQEDRNMQDWVIMQYVGNNDLTNKEIYEDDIIVNKYNNLVVVVTDILNDDYDKYDNCVVLGNIYENPDILNKGDS